MGKTRKIKLGDIVLPVNPVELEVITPQLNKRLTLLNMGTVNLKGNRDVATATISSFSLAGNPLFTAMLICPLRNTGLRLRTGKRTRKQSA